MAEESSELGRAVDTSATAGTDRSLDRFSGEAGFTDAQRLELARDTTDDGPEETEQIKAQIQETRSQMSETIDAIQERLSFANISEQVSETVNSAIESAKETAYDATIGKAVNYMKNFSDGVTQSTAIRTIQSNPLPFALIGLGAGILVYQTMKGGSSSRTDRYAQRSFYGPDDRRLASAAGTTVDASSGTFDGITDKASAALEGVSSAAGNAYESVTGAVGSAAGTAYESVTGAVGSAYTGAGKVANRAYGRVGDFGNVASEKYDEYLEENPLALGALAVAVGAAVGFAIPSTRYEGQLMGEARENLVQRAQDAAGSLVDKAKEVAQEAGQSISNQLPTQIH